MNFANFFVCVFVVIQLPNRLGDLQRVCLELVRLCVRLLVRISPESIKRLLKLAFAASVKYEQRRLRVRRMCPEWWHAFLRTLCELLNTLKFGLSLSILQKAEITLNCIFVLNIHQICLVCFVQLRRKVNTEKRIRRTKFMKCFVLFHKMSTVLFFQVTLIYK